jgi:hypothetical protein
MPLHRTAAETLPGKFINRIGTLSGEIKKFYICPQRVFVYFVRISEQTAIISLYDINWFL